MSPPKEGRAPPMHSMPLMWGAQAGVCSRAVTCPRLSVSHLCIYYQATHALLATPVPLHSVPLCRICCCAAVVPARGQAHAKQPCQHGVPCPARVPQWHAAAATRSCQAAEAAAVLGDRPRWGAAATALLACQAACAAGPGGVGARARCHQCGSWGEVQRRRVDVCPHRRVCKKQHGM
jgi:hypothetical protein